MPDGQFGGRITFEFDGLRIPPTKGQFVLNPSDMEVRAEANHDGSTAYMLEPQPVACEIELRHVDGIDWRAQLLKIGNVTIVEENNNRTHMYTRTKLTGRPQVNLSTGVVSGLRVEGGIYTLLPPA